MKKRWLINLVLLLLVAGLGLFVMNRDKPAAPGTQRFPVASFDPASVGRLSLEQPTKKPVVFEKSDGRWFMLEPFKGRADSFSIGRILAIANADSADRFALADPAKYGLETPQIRVRMDDRVFDYGMFNPVGGEQFVSHSGHVFSVATTFAEVAGTQPLELLDKRPLDSREDIVGFDLSALEQWESSQLQVDLQDDGKWKVSSAAAKPNQDEMNAWFKEWQELQATRVEPFTPDGAQHPYVILKLRGGKKIRLIKMQESPELLLVREDENLQYHFPQDVGFNILNPPVGFKPE